MNEKILITGASGFIGQALAKLLRERKYKVIGLDLNDRGKNSDFDLWVLCDLTKSEEIKEAITQVNQAFPELPLSVVHLAAYYDFSGADSPLYKALTIEGTRSLLRELQGSNVQQFQFSSTILVMNEVRSEFDKIDESSLTNPLWKYPESKLLAEEVIRQVRGNIPAVIHRMGGVYSDWCQSLPIAHQIERIFERSFESFFFPGNIHHGQPFLHISDLTDLVEKTLRNKAKLNPYEIFIVGEEEILTYEMMQNIIGEKLYHREWPTIKIPKPVARVGAWIKDRMSEEVEFIQPWMIDLADAHYPIDISKAKQKLDWSPLIHLKDKLPQFIDQLKNDPEKWYRLNKLDPHKIPRKYRTLSPGDGPRNDSEQTL